MDIKAILKGAKGGPTGCFWTLVWMDLNRVQTMELAISINLQNEGIVQLRGVSRFGEEAKSINMFAKVVALNVSIKSQLCIV